MTIDRKRLTKPLVPAKHREANPPTKEQRLARFKGRGAQGRPKGAPNKVTKLLKDSILMAAECEGSDGKGRQGLVGYLRHVASRHPKEFVHLLAKLLPMEVQASLMELQMQLNQNPDGQLSGTINYSEIKGATTEELRGGMALLERAMGRSRGGRMVRLDKPKANDMGADHEDDDPTLRRIYRHGKAPHAPQVIEGKATKVEPC